jgi:hypothetical protein
VFLGAICLIPTLLQLQFLAWAGPVVTRMNDFPREAWPALRALDHGQLTQFIGLGPPYVGSLVLRAPFALAASLFSSHWPLAYFATALPCILVEAAFCAWLVLQSPTGAVLSLGAQLLPLLVWFLNPIVITALIMGHPEDLLGAALCVAGVIMAGRGRDQWAGVLIGLAIANKAWALIALPVAIAALPRERRLRGLLIAIATASVILVPILLARGQGLGVGATSAQLGAQVSTKQFYPFTLMWWLGPHSWLVAQARILMVVCAVVGSVLWRMTRNGNDSPGETRSREALLLLALVFLLRACLDPADNVYYHAPFVLALLSFEVIGGQRPRVTFLCSVAIIAVVAPLMIPQLGFGNARAAAYAVIMVPMIVGLCVKLFVSPRPAVRSALATSE